jgi:hypothetical protein
MLALKFLREAAKKDVYDTSILPLVKQDELEALEKMCGW